MDRRQHLNSPLSKTSSVESVKQKTTNGNAMNKSNNNVNNHNNNHQHIGYRRNSSSIDSSASANYRKSFPTTSDNSLNNSIQDDHVNNNNTNNSQHSHSHTGSINTNMSNSQYGLTQAGLEEYSRSYYEQNLMYNHQKQSSYAQSEGYHSYVSSSDSTSTPFLDRLRQDSQLLQSRAINWSQEFQTQNNLNSSTNSISSSSNNNLNNINNNNSIKGNNSNSGSTNDCSESTSSSETLKWLGSMSDVSVASQATNTSTLSASSQLIVHSSKVRTPQRHNSESVLYMNDEQKVLGTSSNSTEDLMSESSYQQRQFQQRSSDRSNRSDNRLFPINTYTEPPASLNTSTTSLDAKLLSNHNWQSVADRINELEKQQQQQSIHDHNKQQFTYLDPNKTHRISNPTLKAFQKNAIQSYFERQQQQTATAKINKPSDDMSKSKSICGELASTGLNNNNNNNNNNNSNNNSDASRRPQSLNLSIASQLPMNMQTPSSSSSSASQRSSITGWPSSMPSSASSTMASPTAAFINGCNNNNNMMMMKNNANVDITKMNMKNNAITSMLGEKQLLAGIKMNKHQSNVNNTSMNMNGRNMFTSFCEIKTEKYSSLDAITSSTDNINHSGLNSMTPPPPPPRSKSLMPVRRTSSASEYSSIRDKMLHQKQHLSKDLLGPMIMGQIISVDDWVPERPPKTSALRVPSPELPPPPVANIEHLSSNQDDPLPPPPPELLRQQMKLPEMNDVKLNPASRRNSFAGQSNVPPHVNNMPPAIPMRPKLTPNPIMTVSMHEGLHRRPSSGMDIVKNVCQMPQEQTVHAQRIMVVPQHQPPRQQASPQTATTRNATTDSRVSQRKRTHNSKDCTIYATPIQPPPLKPRMRNQNENTMATGNNVFAPITTKTRSTSKASYLPRQPREKLLDPDHGSYKLTLHELSDNVSGEFQEDLQKCNLPDVLPVGVKYHNPSRHPHHHPQQRPPHHFSQHFTPQPHYHPTETHLTPQTAPILTSNALKSIFHFQMSNPGTPTSSSNPSSNPSSPSVHSSTSSSPLIPSSPFNGSTVHKQSPNTSPIALLQSPKYTSQSSIDMKKTQVLDPKLYTNEELIKTYREQKEACRELNKNILNNYEKSLLSCTPQSVTECDKIAVVRKLNMVESSPVKSSSFENLNSSKVINKSTESLKSLEEKATNEKSEKDQIIENEDKAAREYSTPSTEQSPIHTPTLSISPFGSEFSEALNHHQRSEIIVRVNSVITTQETASQTDEGADNNNADSLVVADSVGDDVIEVKVCSPWTTPVRQRYPEEVDCDKLSKDLVSQLSPSDKLHHILAPKTYKSSADYISDLFKINVTSRPTKKDVSTSTLEKSTINNSMEILTPNSVYFSTSEPKAKLMTRYSREMTLVSGDSSDLTKKKEELVTRLGKKLVVLTNEQTMLVDESTANDVLGNDVSLKVAQKVRPGDSTKFRSYVDDVGYITMLLLSLSGRLARTENALHSIGEKTADKKILEAKRDRLLEQLDEAKHLKEDIDRRGSIIASILENALTTEEYADYDYFINMKAKLIVDSREIADKIKLGEEQLNSLKDTLVQSEC